MQTATIGNSEITVIVCMTRSSKRAAASVALIATAAHRPQLARRASQQRIVHRKRQPRLAVAAARLDHGARAQRVVEVRRVHLRALVGRTRKQARQSGDCAAPRLHERAIARTVLQTDRVECVVERADAGRSGGRSTQRRVVDALPGDGAAARRSGAVHRCRGGDCIGLTAAHLEAPVKDRAIDEHARRLDGERLQEENAAKRRRCPDRSARHLEVARAREDDAALHDVVAYEWEQRACSWRADDESALR